MWTDENGVKHYSNVPPPKNIKNIQERKEQKFDEEGYRYRQELRQAAEQEEQERAKQQQAIIQQMEEQKKAKQQRQEQRRMSFNQVENGMSKAEVLQLCGHPDLKEVSQQWNFGGAGAFDTDWTYFLDNAKMVVVRFRTWAGKSKVKKIINNEFFMRKGLMTRDRDRMA